MKTKVYATYLRVSTQKQGQTQLGLTSQRSMCEGFIKEHNGELGKEFLDIESGTHRDRRGLWDAIEFCNKNHCPLVIATLSRLARDVEFCFKVINTGIEIHFVDMPTINTLLLGVFAAVAQYERELTSDRTKKALAVKKSQGCKLGASSCKYKETRSKINKEVLNKIFMERGELKSKRYLESRDQQAFAKVLRNVFPEYTEASDMKQWVWQSINTRMVSCEKMLKMMKDYQELDTEGKLFCKWDFSDEGACVIKLRSYLQAFRKSVLK